MSHTDEAPPRTDEARPHSPDQDLTAHNGRGCATPEPGRCGARLKRTVPQRYCANPPLAGRTRCHYHGGTSPRGIASPSFQHGMRSCVMPARMVASFEEALNDPDLLSVRREVAVHRAMADDIRRQLAEGGEGTGAALQTAWRDFKAAHRASNPDRIADALSRLDGAIQGRAVEDALRRELRLEDELVQKLTRAENDRMEQLHQMVSREQALAYMRSLAMSVKEAVDGSGADLSVRNAILRTVSSRFEQLNGGRGPADLVARGRASALDPEAGD